MVKNVDWRPLPNPSHFRKLAMGNWDNIWDPQVYGLLEFDCEKALIYIEKLRANHGCKITINHLIGRAMSLVLRRYPQLNGMIVRRKIYLRNNVDIFFQVAMENAETELVGICIRDADKKGIVEFSQEMVERAQRVRASKDDPIRRAQRPFHYIPWRAMPWVLRVMNWVQYDWNINLSWLGIPKDACGSLMITSIGGLGFEIGFVPLTRIGRTPCQIAVGRIHDKPVVVDKQIVIRSRVNLCCTMDHRFMDGLLASKMVKLMRELIENIDKHEDLIEGRAGIEEVNKIVEGLR